ncbi:hypothetical protein PYW07_006901 [Mythimna separata]|uniref:ABC transporter domain-containing protein n=1 Tax=Mythimna separata TaxID=271217 RepID=A0AAD8E111_MYTSE|nr:hypothetical protein PYW07_006901 [Mythimna separata]
MQFVPSKKKGDESEKPLRSRFQRHATILVWKCFLQRQRRWGLIICEALFALLLFIIAIFIAKPVFLIPLQAVPEPPLKTSQIVAALSRNNIVGYAPNNISDINSIMKRAQELLPIDGFWSAPTEDDLNEMLHRKSQGVPLNRPVIWIIWKPKEDHIWEFSIRSTERASIAATTKKKRGSAKRLLRSGFLAIQLALSQAVVEHVSDNPPNFEITLVAMPVSPLMKEESVVRALSGILMCYTLALMPPVLETEALVVTETMNKFKRALRLRNVEYQSMYVGWLVYAYLTCLPNCLLAAVTLILIFRWIHLVEALVVVLAYESVMIMIAMMMAMFHKKAYISCVWTIMFTLLQTYLAELLVHHRYDRMHRALTFFLHLFFPPMGLVHAFNKFALLQTERLDAKPNTSSLVFMVASWSLMNFLYFAVLMMLQRTIGQKLAIGEQVTWKSLIFMKTEDHGTLRTVEPPSRSEAGKVQEVDDLVAKAVSFRDSIMGVPVLNNITFDIYRNEFSTLFAEKVQQTMMDTLEDLLTGLTIPDRGTINVLGETLRLGTKIMTTPQMMGYCHRSQTLIEDLTVQEHLTLYSSICLWNHSQISISEYSHNRSKRLLQDCDLEAVRHERIRNLHIYYKAQLCWALAMMLEPRVIVIPHFLDPRQYTNVIKDKIMRYRKFKTIVSFHSMSAELEYADRVFVFDRELLVFGGTPAYMFFRFGREYRLRLSFKSSGLTEEEQKQLFERVELAGARVRAHLGSLLILRLPTSPSARVAELLKDLHENSKRYGITSFVISVADTDEVCRRAILDSRVVKSSITEQTIVSREALNHFTTTLPWRRQTSCTNTHLTYIMSKFSSFHAQNKKMLAITFVAAVLSGLLLGLSLSQLLQQMDPATFKSGQGHVLNVENLRITTTLVLRADSSATSISIANGYVMSDTKAVQKDIENMDYTAIPHTESLTEYLATRAIDSPQVYVYIYAYGMEVFTKGNKVTVQALYSPIHQDSSAAARSLARVYMALIRHYSGHLDATIKITDDPLVLDLSPWSKELADPPLMIQFLLIMTNSHFTHVPSAEYGLIRHVQKHAINFSPSRYWFTLYFCDLLLYWLLVGVMCAAMLTYLFLTVPMTQFLSIDLLIVPIMLTVYGIGCIPQAYIFSLGPQMALNAIAFVIVNLIFGETTILAKIFYGDTLKYTLEFMTLSPQFNMAYGYVKIERIFLYNNECKLFESKNLCEVNEFHRCCEKCGVLQECFSTKDYFNRDPGVIREMSFMFLTAAFFMTLLLCIEYRLFKRLFNMATSKVANRDKPEPTEVTVGYRREKHDVLEKKAELQQNLGRFNGKVDTFGEYLLVTDLTKRRDGNYFLHNVYLGIGKGEVVAVSGLKHHGRGMLCEILAGYEAPCSGNVWCMSKYKLQSQPHQYSQQVSISCDKCLLPSWMRVHKGLALIAALRGVPNDFIETEVTTHIEALELVNEANRVIRDLPRKDLTRLHFAVAVIGAPPIIILDDCTAFQKFSVRRAMYYILNVLRKRGHAICMSSGTIESHLPLTNRLAILVDGFIFDVDDVDNLVNRYGAKGYTVVVHLKDPVDVKQMFGKYFNVFTINDTTDVLVNVQIQEPDLSLVTVFQKMEKLKEENWEVYSYIVTGIPIDYIYNKIVKKGPGIQRAKGLFSCRWLRKVVSIKPEIVPDPEVYKQLVPFERRYHIGTLKELPWSVMFYR